MAGARVRAGRLVGAAHFLGKGTDMTTAESIASRIAELEKEKEAELNRALSISEEITALTCEKARHVEAAVRIGWEIVALGNGERR